MKHATLMARLYNAPLMCQANYVQTVAQVLQDRAGDVVSEKPSMERREPRNAHLDDDGILTIPIVGGLWHRGDEVDAMSGAQNYTNLNNQLAVALSDRDVKGILFDIDSPGGEATGCFSFARSVKEASQHKPIWCISNGGAFSAAYALGSACERFHCAEDSEVGSIGVVLLHMDYSKHLDQQGIAATYVYAGDHKVDGNPLEPLAPSVRAELQSGIDKRY